MVTGTFTPDDYLVAQRLHRHRISRWSYLGGAIAVLFGLSAWLLSNSIFALLFVGMGVGALFGELIADRWLLPRRAHKLHRQQRDFAHPFTYSWNSEVIEATGVAGHSQRPWTTYHKMSENEAMVLLYHNDNLFEAFPKRWFTDASSLDQFITLARSAQRQ